MRAILKRGLLPDADEREAASILRACVHCGFCNATCPSYQVRGDERDGPRGRLYQMKHFLEGGEVSVATRGHLDRCLGCKACETTCPSGVHYTRLLEFVRPRLEQRTPRSWLTRVLRRTLRLVMPRRALFSPLLGLGRLMRPLLPQALRQWVPLKSRVRFEKPRLQAPRRRLALLEGCVQEVAAPQINAAAAALLGRLDIEVVRLQGVGCCGAIALHLGAEEEALGSARRNVDAWHPLLESGRVDAIFSASSGCSQVLKDYGHLLRHDPGYAERARRVAAAVEDASEAFDPASLGQLLSGTRGERGTLAFQCPCSLQHGLRGQHKVEALLRAAGYALASVGDPHLCCGSAGTYSILQPAIASDLLARKLATLEATGAQQYATANIGCQLHLQRGSGKPVRHWLEVLADAAGCRVG